MKIIIKGQELIIEELQRDEEQNEIIRNALQEFIDENEVSFIYLGMDFYMLKIVNKNDPSKNIDTKPTRTPLSDVLLLQLFDIDADNLLGSTNNIKMGKG